MGLWESRLFLLWAISIIDLLAISIQHFGTPLTRFCQNGSDQQIGFCVKLLKIQELQEFETRNTACIVSSSVPRGWLPQDDAEAMQAGAPSGLMLTTYYLRLDCHAI